MGEDVMVIPVNVKSPGWTDGTVWASVEQGRVVLTCASLDRAFVGELSPEAARDLARKIIDAAAEAERRAGGSGVGK